MRLVALAVLLAAAPAFAQSRQLTMPEAVELAMRQHPSVRQSQASVEAAEGRIDLAKTTQRPNVSVSANVGTGSTRQAPCAADPCRAQ